MWAADGCAGDDDAGRPTVVRDREVLVVWLQRVVRATEEYTDIVRVVQSGVEIRVVEDGEGKMGRDIFEGDENALSNFVVIS